MNNKIKMIMDEFNLSPSEFAQKIEMTSSGVSHILNGRNKPSTDVLLKILNEFPDIDSDWLMRDKPQMLKENNSVNQSISRDDYTSKTQVVVSTGPASENIVIKNIEDKVINEKGKDTIYKQPTDNINNESEKKSETTIVDIPILKNSNLTNSKITKIIIFYEDDTFVEYINRRRV